MRHGLLFAAALLLALPALTWLGATPSEAENPAARTREKPKLTFRERARVELGRRLFFDPAASPSGARSCASCHSPDHGWSDPARVSADDVGDTRRHSQTILDAAFHANAHWDGEFGSVEELVVARLGTDPRQRTPGGGYGGHTPFTPRGSRRAPAPAPGTPVTPGERRGAVGSVQVPLHASPLVASRLAQAGRYEEAFKAAFGDKEPTLERIARAIAAFTRSVESTISPYDHFVAGNLDAISASAKRGKALFEGRAGCNQCHASDGEHAFFTDFAFHNTGVSMHHITALSLDQVQRLQSMGAEQLRLRLLRKAKGDEPAALAALLREMSDQGRRERTGRKDHARAFKTPTLRDVAKRGPYMHDGRFETLADVVRYYAKGCGPDEHKSEKLRPFECSEQDVQDLVAFLESLSGLTQPGAATEPYTLRARYTRLTLVDAAGEPLKKLPVELVPVGQAVPTRRGARSGSESYVTSTQGRIRFAAGDRTHMRVVLPEGLPVAGGNLVPDACKQATLTVPVAGRMTFVITFGEHETPPAFLIGTHPTHQPLPGHPQARTRFERIGGVARIDGGRVAKYEGWARTDVGSAVKLVIPGRSLKDGQGQGRRKSVYAISAGAEYRLDARSR